MGGFSLKIGENRNMLKKEKKTGKKKELDTLHFFGALEQQNRAQARLLYLLNGEI